MRIAIVHSFYKSATPSGENVAVKAQYQALTRAGHTVDLVDCRTDEVMEQPFYKIRSALRTTTGLGANPLRSLAEIQPDVVHLHNLFPNWASGWLRRSPFKVVSTLHNFRNSCAAATFYRDGQQCTDCLDAGPGQAVRHSCYGDSKLGSLVMAAGVSNGARRDPVVMHSANLITMSPRAKGLFERSGVPAERMTVIPNFSAPASVISRQEDLDPAEWLVVARLTSEKGVAELVSSWPDGVGLNIIGDGELRETISRSISEKQRIRLLGALPNWQVKQAMLRAKGLVFPSQCIESAPALTYVEALSCGLPVISLRGNSVGDDVSEAGCGQVLMSWDELPDALTDVEHQLKAYRAAAARRYQSEFTEEVWVDRVTRLYESVVHAT